MIPQQTKTGAEELKCLKIYKKNKSKQARDLIKREVEIEVMVSATTEKEARQGSGRGQRRWRPSPAHAWG